MKIVSLSLKPLILLDFKSFNAVKRGTKKHDEM